MDVGTALQLAVQPLTRAPAFDMERVERCVLAFGFPPVEWEAVGFGIVRAAEDAEREGPVATIGDAAELAIEFHAWLLLSRALDDETLSVMIPRVVRDIGAEEFVRADDGEGGAGTDEDGLGPRISATMLHARIDVTDIRERLERGAAGRVMKAPVRSGTWPLARYHADFLDHGSHLAEHRARVRGDQHRYQDLGRAESLERITLDLAEHTGAPAWLSTGRLRSALSTSVENAVKSALRTADRMTDEVARGADREDVDGQRARMLKFAADREGRPAPTVVRFLGRIVAHLEEEREGASLRTLASAYHREHGRRAPAFEPRLLALLGSWSCSRVAFRWPLPASDGGTRDLTDPRELPDPAHDQLHDECSVWLDEGDPDAHLHGAFAAARSAKRDPEDGEKLVQILLSQSLGVGRAQHLHADRWRDSARSRSIERFGKDSAIVETLHRHMFQNGVVGDPPCPCSAVRGSGS